MLRGSRLERIGLRVGPDEVVVIYSQRLRTVASVTQHDGRDVDTVLCLALMHHLHITGRQSFERIAELLNDVTGRHLIFEFVARDDANIPLLPQRRHIDYSLESVVAALGRHFKDIDVRSSDRATRRLLVCRK